MNIAQQDQKNAPPVSLQVNWHMKMLTSVCVCGVGGGGGGGGGATQKVRGVQQACSIYRGM